MKSSDSTSSTAAPERVVFSTVGDSVVFPGVVGLLNSLRAVGHDEELLLLDAGFTPSQRAALEPHCTIVDPPEAATHPTLYKPFPHVAGADGVVVVLDADAVVTAPLTSLVAAAREGRICAFPDPAEDRFFPEWAELWGLRAPLRQGIYVSAGYLVFSTRRHPDLLPRWWGACRRTFEANLVWDKYDRRVQPCPDDQEALNALLMSEFPADALELLPRSEIVHGLEGMSVRVLDRTTLACERDGRRVRYLHAGGSPKPWQAEAAPLFRPDPYNRLLRRLFHADDVPLRFPPGEYLAPWLRSGPPGALSLWGRGLYNGIGSTSFWVQTLKRVLSAELYGGLRRSWRFVMRRAQAPAA